MRGRLAIPIHDAHGTLVAYCGRAVNGESPTLIFPNGFSPTEHIFGAHRITPGPLYLMRDPLDVLKAHDGGIDNAVSFLTEVLHSQQLEMLAALLEATGSNGIELK